MYNPLVLSLVSNYIAKSIKNQICDLSLVLIQNEHKITAENFSEYSQITLGVSSVDTFLFPIFTKENKDGSFDDEILQAKKELAGLPK